MFNREVPSDVQRGSVCFIERNLVLHRDVLSVV